MKFVFGADLHGNIIQYEKVFSYAVDYGADVLCLCGDLTPKTGELRTPKHQKEFIDNTLFPLIKSVKNKLKVLLIMGNDDYKSNYNYLISNQHLGFSVISDNPAIINDYYFVGYSYVPYTPFEWKDWEKRDLETDTIKDIKTETRREGQRSEEDGSFSPYNIVSEMMQDSIEMDLIKVIHDIPPNKLILVTHAPPYNTDCDYTKLKDGGYAHVGSKAIKKIIKTYQPLMSVHGHIHDTVQNTGVFPFKIGNTFCAAVSSDFLNNNVHIVCGEINNINLLKIERLKL